MNESLAPLSSLSGGRVLTRQQLYEEDVLRSVDFILRGTLVMGMVAEGRDTQRADDGRDFRVFAHCMGNLWRIVG